MTHQATVLIVAKPGPMRDSLRALLLALPPVKDIEQVEDGQAALQALTRLQPALMLLDAGLLAGIIGTLLGQARTVSPRTRSILLAHSMAQKQSVQADGADAVLLHGIPAAELARTIERLLGEPSAQP